MDKSNKKKIIIILSTVVICIMGVWGVFLILDRICSKVSDHLDENKDAFSLMRDENELTDADYFDSVNEAMQHSVEGYRYPVKEEDVYKYRMDEVILQLQNENYTSVYYKSVKNKKEICFTYAKFKIKEVGGLKKYAYLYHQQSDDKTSYSGGGKLDECMDIALEYCDFDYPLNIDPKNTRFIFGTFRKDLLKEGEDVNNLKVEGQKPDGMLEYQRFNETWYLWYYTDLKSRKSASELKWSID